MNKTDLINKLKQLEGLTQEERAALIELVNTKKKYGLVWEDKPEEVEEQLRTHLPVLREVVENRILADQKESSKEDEHYKVVPLKVEAPDTLFPDMEKKEKVIEQTSRQGEAPNHILIEGDNLHALTALTFTHEGKIDVIYIDPPYNTGNKDFKYNDSFVDKEDSYRHSKWLSFMEKRLRIAKRLLSEKGVIFISIDDNEQAQLKLLCDEIFGGDNFLSNVIWQHSLQAKGYTGKISLHHNYTLIYKKSDLFTLGLLDRTEEHNVSYSNPDNDPRGLWRNGDVRNALVRKNLMYNIVTPSGKIINHPPKGWRFSFDTFQKELKDGKIIFSQDETRIIRKIYLADQDGRVPESIWFGKETGTTRDGTQILKDIFGESMVFDSPKPVQLLNRILQIGGNKTSIILDFFAGSGTTLHATMQLNAEDGGNRQCILVTNNENNICEEVTYERNKRVIQGYINSKGQWVEGLSNNNLRYYKSELLGREPSLKNKRELTRLATELLCIKEDCYTEQKLEGHRHIHYFHENGNRFMMVYEDTAIEEAVELIKQLIATENIPDNGIKVYVFSPGQYPFTEEFEEVWPWIKLCALPDAIYKAYMNVLPKKVRKSAPVIEEETEETTEPKLFD